MKRRRQSGRNQSTVIIFSDRQTSYQFFPKVQTFSWLMSSVVNNIMHRDIILRTAVSEKSDTQSVKLIDSRGKRSANSKISIYSQKYTTVTGQPQRQELKLCRNSQKKMNDQIANHSSNSIIRQGIVVESRKQDNAPKGTPFQETILPATLSFQITESRQDKMAVDASLAASFREHLQAVRIYYQGKIKQIVQENAKSISQLRNMLVQQQQRLSQKEDQINRLLSATQNKMAVCRPPVRVNINDSPYKTRAMNAGVSFEYLTNKVKDLDINLRLIMEQFVDSENQVKQKMEKVEKGIIRHFAQKFGRCWFRLTKLVQNIQGKYTCLESNLGKVQKQFFKSMANKNIQTFYHNVSSQIHAKMNELEQDINNFAKKQYKYQNQTVESLQTVLIDLLHKFSSFEKRSSLRGSRRTQNGYYLQDQDEFFYPSSERKVYETSDDYEHFQSESQEETTFTKQNINNNMQQYQTEKLKKI